MSAEIAGMTVNGIDAIYYFAQELARAQAFYTVLIGTPPTIVFPESFCEWTLPGGEAFGIVKGESYRPCNGVLFNVADVKAAVAELRDRGVVFNDDGEIEETLVCYMAFGNDSEGNGFILHQRK
jgi:predicted enzyme related to lactoylglutathione lyase